MVPYCCSSSRSRCLLSNRRSPRSRQASSAASVSALAPFWASSLPACPSNSARNSSASQVSLSLNAFTANPRRPAGCKNPWDASVGRMFRIGVRDTPSWTARPSSVMRWPGASSPPNIISRTLFIKGTSPASSIGWTDPVHLSSVTDRSFETPRWSRSRGILTLAWRLRCLVDRRMILGQVSFHFSALVKFRKRRPEGSWNLSKSRARDGGWLPSISPLVYPW